MHGKVLRQWAAGIVAGLLSVNCFALEPADNVIANALADVERYESQAAALTPGRAANANRILKLMNLSKERLAASPNQSDPSWGEVNARYEALEVRLAALMNPSATSSNGQAEAAPSAKANQPTAPSEPVKSAVQVTAPAAPASNVPQLVSGQRVQVKKLARDIGNSQSSLTTTGPSPFQDPNEVAARQKGLQQYTDAINRYPQVDDPDVQAARSAYSAYRESLEAEFERAKSQLAELGDVQARLAQLAGNYAQYPVPAALNPPFTQAEAQQWVEAASAARTVAEHNAGQLNQMAPLAYLPETRGTPEQGAPYDAGDFRRMQERASQILSEVQGNYESMSNTLTQRMNGMESDVLSRWQESPEDPAKLWLFLSKEQQQDAANVFAENKAWAQSAVFLEKALGRDTTSAQSMLDRLEQAELDYQRKGEIALENSKLPEAVSSDRGMRKIAEGIMDNPRYEFGEYGDIILTTKEIVERERKSSEVEFDDIDVSLSGDITLSGTETTWTYRWQEFKFATPVKDQETGEWSVWWFVAKNFTSGGPNTPLNQWISGGITVGNRILPKHL